MKFAQQIQLPCLTRIVEKFGHVHLSAGDLLRAERASPGSQVGKKLPACIRNMQHASNQHKL